MAMAARMPMMMMTTRSSIRVKPWSFSFMDFCSTSDHGVFSCGGRGECAVPHRPVGGLGALFRRYLGRTDVRFSPIAR